MNKEEVVPEVTNEILDHMMNPRNYGEIEEPDCTGIGFDEKTNEFVAVYADIKDQTIKDIKFGTNGCTDTVVAGSLFTDMIKGDTVNNAKRASQLMREKIKDVPPKQRACSMIVLTGFDAAMQNYEDRAGGRKDELCKLKMEESCEGIGHE